MRATARRGPARAHMPSAPKGPLAALVLGLSIAVLAAQAVPAGPEEETVIRSHGYSFFGDLTYPPDYAHFDYVNPDAPKGGEISLHAPGTFDSMNPYSRKGRAGTFSWMVYESLLGEMPATGAGVPADVYGEMYGLLAESLEYDEGKTWVIFHMRPEARFADGHPVTAEDVVFSHNLFLEQGLPSYAQAVSRRVTGAEALDEHTVKFTFAEDISRRSLIDQVGSTPVFPKHWYEETGARLDEPRLDAAPGSGPYQLDEYEVNRRIVYQRDPDYWGKDLPINVGRHNFDTIRVEYFADDGAAFEAFKTGIYTFRSESNSKKWATGYEFPAVDKGHVKLEELADGTPPTPSGFVFNLGREKLQDVRVRKAIALAYNFEWTNESLQYGLFAQRHSFVQDTPLQARGKPQGAELELLKSLGDVVPEEMLIRPAVRAHDSRAERLNDRDNLRKAMSLLDEADWKLRPPPALPPTLSAGWAIGLAVVVAGAAFGGVLLVTALPMKIGIGVLAIAMLGGLYHLAQPVPREPDGLRRNADGERLTIDFPIPSSLSATMGAVVESFVNNLQKMGIDASYEKVDPSQYTLRNRERDYDIVFDSYSAFLEAGTGLMQRYGSTEAEFSLFNPAGLASPMVDAIINAALNSETREEEQVALRALDRALRFERFMVPVWYNDSNWVAYWDIYDHPDDLPPYALGVLDFWWFDAEQAAALEKAGAL